MFGGSQYLPRLAGPAFTPLGGPSIYAAWWAQYLRRLVGPANAPLGGPSKCAAWRAQQIRRLVGPAFTPLGGPSKYAAWWAQHLRRLADPVFTPLGCCPQTQYLPRLAAVREVSVYPAWRLSGKPVFNPLGGYRYVSDSLPRGQGFAVSARCRYSCWKRHIRVTSRYWPLMKNSWRRVPSA